MRKILALGLVLLILISYLVYSKLSNHINLKLDDEIGIVFINSNMLLVMSEKDATLLVLKDDKDTAALDRFKYDHLNVLMLYDNKIDIKYDKKIILDNEYEINEVTYSIKNNLIYINYEGTNTCIYRGKVNNISNCQFVYFYNVNVSNIILSDYNEMIIDHYKYPLSKSFLDTVHKESIKTHHINDNKLTVLKIGEEDYDVVVIDNK